MAQDFESIRLKELALRAKYGTEAVFTRFLEPSLEKEARFCAADADVQLAFFGGYTDAERKIAAFYPWEAPCEAAYPLCCIELRWNAKYAAPTHRDLLGAVMSLGLERSAIGDIAIGAKEGCAYLFAHRDVAAYLCANLESAGRAPLKLRVQTDAPELRPPQGDEIRVTVPSERMDAIVAAALKLSRTEAQRLIVGDMVKRNHCEELRGDIHLEEGDLLSVRGYGRIRVIALDGLTRKGRHAVRLFKYTG